MSEIKPMVVSIWCGDKKPNNLCEFLQPLVEELNMILRNGISINGYRIDVKINSFICDSPARSFVKGSFR